MYIYIYIDIYIVSILHIGVGLETLKLGLPSRQERLGPHPWAPRVGAQRRGHGRPGAGRAPAAGGQSQRATELGMARLRGRPGSMGRWWLNQDQKN